MCASTVPAIQSWIYLTKQLRNESPLELIARHIMDSGQRRKFATLGSNAKSSQELKIILGTSKYFWKSYLKFVLSAGPHAEGGHNAP